MILGYAGAVLTGLVLGLLGGGGALLSIPVLVYLFHIPASVATGYSLFLVGITASSGALQNIRKKSVDYRAILYYGFPSVITVYAVRRFLIPNMPEIIFSSSGFILNKNDLILLFLSVAMFAAGIRMLKSDDRVGNKEKHQLNLPLLFLYAVLIGAFLGLVGAGGGFLMIPALVYFANLTMKKAVGSSLVLVAINSFIGFLGDIHSSQTMDWSFLLTFSAFSITGVLAGHYLGHFINEQKLRKSFGGLMIVIGVFVVVKEIASSAV